MADTAQLEAWLAEIEEVEQAFYLGEREVKITRDNGDDIVFNKTSLGALKRRKQSILRQLGRPAGSIVCV